MANLVDSMQRGWVLANHVDDVELSSSHWSAGPRELPRHLLPHCSLNMLNSLLAIGLLQVSLSGAGQVPLTPLEYATPADARLFSYNTVLGPILQIPYDNKGLIAGIEALGLGSVRYPGGTVADYWSMAKGNYIDHCEQSLCSCC